MLAKGWEKTREATSIEGRQARLNRRNGEVDLGSKCDEAYATF